MSSVDPATIRLVNRRAEMQWLESVSRRVLETRSARIATVLGPRGVGKSRIVDAFARRHTEMRVLSAICVGHGAEPLLPIRDALRPALGTTARTVRSALRRSAPELLGGVPVVGKFLAGFGRELMTGQQIGGNNPRGLYDVLASVLVKLSEPTGLCLILEDIHLADPDTLSFLTYVLNKSRNSPTLTIVTLPAEQDEAPAVADYLSEWEERGGDELTVGPLGREHVKEYAFVALDGVTLSESRLDSLCTFTGGNPLLLSESLRQWPGPNAEEVPLGANNMGIPSKIHRLLERRLKRLDPQTRLFVEAAAVVAETSQQLQPILHVLKLDESSGLATLDHACKMGLLNESEDGRVTFTSEILHTVAYEELRPNQRRSLHVHAGEWFEAAQQHLEAAHHFERAEDWHRMVPVAFRAADMAEHVGLYPAALSLYRRLQSHTTPAVLFPRMVRALLVVGDWAEAERVLGVLPSNDPKILLLRAQLCLARGDVFGAARHATRALSGGAEEELDALLSLATIQLSAGEFREATRYAGQALQLARDDGSIDDQARCQVVIGACQSHNGDPEAAEAAFRNGIWLLDSYPPDTRDVGAYSALLGNLGYLEEITQRWADAKRSHNEALALRKNVADVVGVLESTLAVGRVALGQGDRAGAEVHLTQAFGLAVDLGEELQQAKVVQARGELAAQAGDVDAGRLLLEDARARFVKCGTPYDIAFVDLLLARILSATRPRESVERLARGRAAAEKRGFKLLRRIFPELGPDLGDRIRAGLLAYVAGDAFGLPWEGCPPAEVKMAELDRLPDRGVWPSGATSDDTALTLLVAEHLAAAGGLGDPLRFLATLVDRSPSIKGLGPSTKRAIEHFTATGTPDESGSDTNGAPMRALPVGWAVPIDAEDRRRQWTLRLTRMTHTGKAALTAACVMSACAAWAVEGAPAAVLVEVAAEEAVAIGSGTSVADALTGLRDGWWRPPSGGITLDPAETVTAVLYCCREADGDLASALRHALSLGGDTDTVAALVGGLLGCRLTTGEVAATLPWLDRVVAPPAEDLSRLGDALAAVRSTTDE